MDKLLAALFVTFPVLADVVIPAAEAQKASAVSSNARWVVPTCVVIIIIAIASARRRRRSGL
ncbi:MAG TPA: hypothetical protein VND45_15545 [Thermoanaerobaculia bacterium]|nr:hypothetical protein [Thermoanaerobaculia bacterium]